MRHYEIEPSAIQPYEQHYDRIKHFINWVFKVENIQGEPPKIVFADEKDSEDMHHTGWYNHEKNILWVYTGNRNLIDILRTVAHELRHYKQGIEGKLLGKDGPGSPNERDADAAAGYLMKLYGKQYPDILE
jgi:hypothetical protein